MMKVLILIQLLMLKCLTPMNDKHILYYDWLVDSVQWHM